MAKCYHRNENGQRLRAHLKGILSATCICQSQTIILNFKPRTITIVLIHRVTKTQSQTPPFHSYERHSFAQVSNQALHYAAFILLALFQVTFVLVQSQHHGLTFSYSSDFDYLFPLKVPPSQPLDQTTTCIICSNHPLSRSNFNLAPVFWEMKLGQSNICGLRIRP